MDLLNKNVESEILYQNDELIIFQQEKVKWIVTKDNQILMTVKDIGLLGDNEDKTKRYERELRNKEFITPYNGKTIKCIYEQNLFKLLKDNPRGRNPDLYNYPAITQIIAELRTVKARERNQKLGILQEEIRTKGYFIVEGKEIEALNHLKSLRADVNNVFKVLTSIFSKADDYAPKSPELGIFFATMRNKLYQCVVGMTAAEILHNRADHTKENMNLITWKGKKGVTKSDAQRAIGYLTDEEMDILVKVTNIVIDSLEVFTIKRGHYKQQQTIDLFDFYINSFADEIPTGYGKINTDKAKKYAIDQYNKFKRRLTRL